jgi:hypothetical protein
MGTLTRAAAYAVIEEHEDDGTLDALREHWIGHADGDMGVEDLQDYVDECCLTDSVRSNGPRDSDDTGLTAP